MSGCSLQDLERRMDNVCPDYSLSPESFHLDKKLLICLFCSLVPADVNLYPSHTRAGQIKDTQTRTLR